MIERHLAPWVRSLRHFRLATGVGVRFVDCYASGELPSVARALWLKAISAAYGGRVLCIDLGSMPPLAAGLHPPTLLVYSGGHAVGRCDGAFTDMMCVKRLLSLLTLLPKAGYGRVSTIPGGPLRPPRSEEPSCPV